MRPFLYPHEPTDMTRTQPAGRRAGVLLPLFSMPSSRSWGIGEIADLPLMARWLRDAGVSVLQLLPINEIAAGQTSPYSAISAMAIDPIYISLHAVADFTAYGGESRMVLDDQAAIRTARAAARVEYESVRRAKEHSLRGAFEAFYEVEWLRGTGRAGAFAAFVSWEEWWIADYALYRALKSQHGGRSWTEWPEPLRRREPAALVDARGELEREILYYQYLQWLADDQWQDARAAAGLALFGDFPFMVSTDSADVWSRQHLFRFDATVGTPPDAFSESGQDWGLPVYRWDVMAQEDYAWLRARAKRSAKLFDGYRVDHLVGFYRTYSRPLDGRTGSFEPSEEPQQLALGETLMRLFLESGAEIIAEDLGTVPDFVRESLVRLGIPGYRVLRWEREWNEPGQPFRNPRDFPALSVATTGTHDTDPLAVWWDEAPADERRAFAELPDIAPLFAAGHDPATTPFTPELRDVMLELLYRSGSDLLLVPLPDIFGWRDRINVPATVSRDNWSYKLPWPIDRLPEEPEPQERARAVLAWADECGRIAGETA
jgi:4-alpha-glucanotransferase